MKQTKRAKAENFIVDWLSKSRIGIDILDSIFIDKFIEATGAGWFYRNWGAYKCPLANRTLNSLYHSGRLTRKILSLGGNWQPGFPKWVYTYSLNT